MTEVANKELAARARAEREQRDTEDALQSLCELPAWEEMTGVERKEYLHMRAEFQDWKLRKAQPPRRKVPDDDDQDEIEPIGSAPTWNKFGRRAATQMRPFEFNVLLELHAMFAAEKRETPEKRVKINRSTLADRLGISRATLYRLVPSRRLTVLFRTFDDQRVLEKFEALRAHMELEQRSTDNLKGN